MLPSFLVILILSSAIWRLSSLVANETGPFHMFKRFRMYCGTLCEDHLFWRRFHLYELVNCEWCLSMWMGFIIVPLYYLFGNVVTWLALPLALSCYAIVIKQSVHVLQEVCSYLVHLQKEGGE